MPWLAIAVIAAVGYFLTRPANAAQNPANTPPKNPTNPNPPKALPTSGKWLTAPNPIKPPASDADIGVEGPFMYQAPSGTSWYAYYNWHTKQWGGSKIPATGDKDILLTADSSDSLASQIDKA